MIASTIRHWTIAGAAALLAVLALMQVANAATLTPVTHRPRTWTSSVTRRPFRRLSG